MVEVHARLPLQLPLHNDLEEIGPKYRRMTLSRVLRSKPLLTGN